MYLANLTNHSPQWVITKIKPADFVLDTIFTPEGNNAAPDIMEHVLSHSWSWDKESTFQFESLRPRILRPWVSFVWFVVNVGALGYVQYDTNDNVAALDSKSASRLQRLIGLSLIKVVMNQKCLNQEGFAFNTANDKCICERLPHRWEATRKGRGQ